MKIAFIMFDDFTFLDLIGFYDAVTRLKTMKFIEDLSWDICALNEEVSDDKGLIVKATKVNKPLNSYDIIYIPGGMGTRKLQYDKAFISWIKTAKDVKQKISVCTGSLILGASGFLENKKATTHQNAIEDLKQYTNKAEYKRIVEEKDIITGSGVSTSIDLGLYTIEKLTSKDVKEKIAKQMNYPYFT
jgi:transcriptional regulator GlxA family with amidase domain